MKDNAKQPNILVAVEDPGAANALAPIVRRLMQEDRVRVSCLCRTLAAPIFRSFHIPFQEVGPDVPLAEKTVSEQMRTTPPQLVFLGTSESSLSLDRFCFKQAKMLGIPTVGLVDYWTRYVQRFSGPTPEERLRYLPDLIFVVDEAARQAMTAEGFPDERLVVAGHPYLDSYADRVMPLSQEAKERFRKELGVKPGQPLVTFVSETLDDWQANASYRFPPLSGSKERTLVILEHVIQALTEWSRQTHRPVFLVNKLHPKNRFEEFAFLEEIRPPFPIRSVQQADNGALLQSSSLVVGMTSMLVVEAACLGIPTLSIVPLPHEEKYGPNGRLSWSVARSPEALRKAFDELMTPEGVTHGREVAVQIQTEHRGAVQRIVEHLYQRISAASS